MAMTPPGSGMDETEHDPRLAALYRAGGETQQPSAHLDDAIRAAARRAVQAGPRRSDRFRRWSRPLSLAAVIVLSVTVVTMMREEGADRWGADDVRQLPPAPSAGIEKPDRAAAEPASRPAAPAERRMETVQTPAAAPPAAPVQRPQAAGKTASGLAEKREREPPAAVPPAAEIAAGPSAAQEASAGADAGAREDRAPPRALRRSAPAAVMADASRGEETMMAKQAAPAGAAVAKPGDSLWQDLEQEPAGKWLERLRELRRDGRSADFARLVAEFRRRFPDTALPDDLR